MRLIENQAFQRALRHFLAERDPGEVRPEQTAAVRRADPELQGRADSVGRLMRY
jgi:hypothetical protein